MAVTPEIRTACPLGTKRLLLGLILAGELCLLSPLKGLSASADRDPPEGATTRSHCFFQSPQLCTFQVELGPNEYRQLGQNPRTYVPGRVRVDGQIYEGVGIRL